MGLLSEAELTDALIKELCSGRKFMEENLKFREKAAAQDAAESRGHKTHGTFGKKLLSVPDHEYFLLRQKYGDDCFHEKEFIRDFQRLEPDLTVHKA